MLRYDSDAEFREILRRTETLRKRKERGTIQTLASSSAAFLILLILGICLFSRREATEEIRSVYGAFLLPAEAGGYVLAAVAAFVIGVIVTVVCIRYREKRERDQ